MAEVILTNDNFEAEVLNSDIPVIVDFFATWCGPCKMLAPIIEEISEELEGKVKVCKLDIDECRKLALKYYVASVPTVALFKDGKPAAVSIGYRRKEDLLAELGLA
jgi:thioredoxin 1